MAHAYPFSVLQNSVLIFVNVIFFSKLKKYKSIIN